MLSSSLINLSVDPQQSALAISTFWLVYEILTVIIDTFKTPGWSCPYEDLVFQGRDLNMSYEAMRLMKNLFISYHYGPGQQVPNEVLYPIQAVQIIDIYPYIYAPWFTHMIPMEGPWASLFHDCIYTWVIEKFKDVEGVDDWVSPITALLFG